MAHVIAFVSGKGGVGKTMIAANIAYALALRNIKTLVIDANVSGSNLAVHLGLKANEGRTLNDVLLDEISWKETIQRHHSGLEVITASLKEYETDIRKLKKVLPKIKGYDYIFIDAAAGTGGEAAAAIEAADASILIVNPETPSISNAFLVKKLIEEKRNELIGIVINRARKEKWELSKEEIEEFLGAKVFCVVPEEEKIRESIWRGVPIMEMSYYDAASLDLRRLSYTITNEEEKMSPIQKFRTILRR